MANFQEKKNHKNFFHSKPVLVVLSLLLVLFLLNVIKLANKAVETKRNKEIAQAKITELQEQKVKLESNIQKLNTEKGIEENIREKFGLAKEGEGLGQRSRRLCEATDDHPFASCKTCWQERADGRRGARDAGDFAIGE